MNRLSRTSHRGTRRLAPAAVNLRRLLTTMALGLALTMSLLAASAQTAEAYDNSDLRVEYVKIDAGNCDRIYGSLNVSSQGSYCVSYDSIDDTYFHKDAGTATALKLMIYNGSSLVSKIEFHPHGEKLWIYDTRNDGDRLFVEIVGEPYAHAPVGSSDRIDVATVDFSLPDGTWYDLKVCDGRTYDGWCNGDVVTTWKITA